MDNKKSSDKVRNIRIYEDTLNSIKHIRENCKRPYSKLSLTDFLYWYIKEMESVIK